MITLPMAAMTTADQWTNVAVRLAFWGALAACAFALIMLVMWIRVPFAVLEIRELLREIARETLNLREASGRQEQALATLRTEADAIKRVTAAGLNVTIQEPAPPPPEPPAASAPVEEREMITLTKPPW